MFTQEIKRQPKMSERRIFSMLTKWNGKFHITVKFNCVMLYLHGVVWNLEAFILTREHLGSINQWRLLIQSGKIDLEVFYMTIKSSASKGSHGRFQRKFGHKCNHPLLFFFESNKSPWVINNVNTFFDNSNGNKIIPLKARKINEKGKREERRRAMNFELKQRPIF